MSDTYDIYGIGSIDISGGTHIVRTVFPKGGVTFAALEVTSGKPIESERLDVSESAETVEKGRGNCMVMILSVWILCGSGKAMSKKRRYTE